MGRNLIYPKTAGTTMNRKKQRGTYDLGTIHSIINSTSVLHVSFNPSPEDPFPATLPMIGHLGSFEHPSDGLDDPLDLYLHGYVSSRIMDTVRSSPSPGAFEGLPMTIAATKVDGLVLSLTPNSHSYNYRSAILQGYATLVTDAEEKLYAMRLITNKVLADRWDNTRTPPDSAEMSSTSILKVRIVAGSGKIRTGGPNDEAKDTDRQDLTSTIWTGVVPVWETLGEPVKLGPGNVDIVPEYVREAVEERSKEAEKEAKAAMKST